MTARAACACSGWRTGSPPESASCLRRSRSSPRAMRSPASRAMRPRRRRGRPPSRSCGIPRRLSDDLVRAVVARDGVVAAMPVNWALQEGWTRGDARVPLAVAAGAVVELCEVAGGARHVGLGTDFDGGQGAEAAPEGIETIADLPKLGDALRQKGMSEADVA